MSTSIAAPSQEEIFESLRCLVGAGTEIERVSAHSLTGADADPMLMNALALAAAGGTNSIHQWPLWQRLNLNVNFSGGAGIIELVYNFSSGNTVSRSAALLSAALDGINRRGVLITTEQPHASIWDDGPSDWLRIICPAGRDGAGTHLRAVSEMRMTGLESLRLYNVEAPADDVGATAVLLRNHVIGWVAGNKVWLRFHPFLNSEGRFSAASPQRRSALLTQVFALIAPHLADIPAGPTPSALRAWRSAVSHADWSLRFVRGSVGPLGSDYEQIHQEQLRARSQIRTLELQLESARAAAAIADVNAAPLPTLLRARELVMHGAIEALQAQLRSVNSLPQVQSVEIWQEASNARRVQPLQVEVLTNALVLDCGNAGMRLVPPLRFRLPVQESGDPSFPDGVRAHPALTGSGVLDFSAVSAPLAQALGSGDLRGAVTIVCSLLARPLPGLNNEQVATPTPTPTPTTGARMRRVSLNTAALDDTYATALEALRGHPELAGPGTFVLAAADATPGYVHS